MSPSPFSLDNRFEVANSWVDAAQNIVADHDLIEAGQVIEFISDRNNVTVATPISLPDGRWGLQKYQLAPISLVPLDAVDGVKHPYFDRLNTEGIPKYMEPEKALYIHTDLSPTIGGLVLIHEGLHAMAHLHKWWDSKDRLWADWVNEHQAYTVEHTALRAIGGDDYAELVKTIVEQFQNDYDNHNFNGNLTDDHLTEVSKVFAVEAGSHSLSMLSAAVIFDAYFTLARAHTIYPRDITGEVDFIKYFYMNTTPVNYSRRVTISD